MSIIRMDRNVPVNYVKESRDFLVLLRLLTMAESNVKYNVDSILYLNDPFLINNKLLHLLCTKLGFYTHENFTDDEIRHVLSAFAFLVKNKGNRIAISSAINLFFKLNKIDSSASIDIDNVNYVVNIGLNLSPRSTTLLTEIFRYILPAGYLLNIYFYQPTSTAASLDSEIIYSVTNLDPDENAHINNLKVKNISSNNLVCKAITEFEYTIPQNTSSLNIKIGGLPITPDGSAVAVNDIKPIRDDFDIDTELESISNNVTGYEIYASNNKMIIVANLISINNNIEIEANAGLTSTYTTFNKIVSWNCSTQFSINLDDFRCTYKDDREHPQSEETVESNEQILNDLLITTSDGRIVRDFTATKKSGSTTRFTILLYNLNKVTGITISRKLSTRQLDTMFVGGEMEILG